jgi:hypothetical protein
MKRIHVIGRAVVVLLAVGAAMGQRTVPLAENAALRYWAAFSQLQDSALTDQEAKELDSALDKMGPFDISRYNDLIQKNTLALEIMGRGSSLPSCDWGLDYGLGGDTPVDYARKALVLGRLNILYAMQLYHSGNPDRAIEAVAAGLRFSHDVANGGSLFATLVAKDLLVTHLMAVNAALRMGQLSTTQRSRLQNAIASLGDGLDWSAASKRDLEALGSHYSGETRVSAALGRISSSYAAFLKDESNLPNLMEAINHAPPELANLIPNPKRIQEQKQELSEKLQQTRMLLQTAAPR